MKEERKFQNQKAFGEWVEKTKRFLIPILQENPEKINGFRFYEFYNVRDDPDYTLDTIVRLPNGNFSIEIRTPYSGWDSKTKRIDYQDGSHYINYLLPPDYKIIGDDKKYKINEDSGYTTKEIVNKLLNPRMNGIHSWGSNHFENSARNRFIKSLEAKIGLPLKNN